MAAALCRAAYQHIRDRRGVKPREYVMSPPPPRRPYVATRTRDRAGPPGPGSAGGNEVPLSGESVSHRVRTVRAVRPRALLERLLAGTVTNVAFSDAQKLFGSPRIRRAAGKGQPPSLRSPWHSRAAQPSGPRRASKALPAPAVGRSRPAVRSQHRGGRVIPAAAYPINVFWSDEDEAWVADVPDLDYCSATGDTPHAAVSEVEVAIEAWLEAARSSGRPIPAPSVRAVHA